jgi:hypothetical protein
MAILKCGECGKDVSTLAKACPGCGAPPPLERENPEPAHSQLAPSVSGEPPRPKRANQWTVPILIVLMAVIIALAAVPSQASEPWNIVPLTLLLLGSIAGLPIGLIWPKAIPLSRGSRGRAAGACLALFIASFVSMAIIGKKPEDVAPTAEPPPFKQVAVTEPEKNVVVTPPPPDHPAAERPVSAPAATAEPTPGLPASEPKPAADRQVPLDFRQPLFTRPAFPICSTKEALDQWRSLLVSGGPKAASGVEQCFPGPDGLAVYWIGGGGFLSSTEHVRVVMPDGKQLEAWVADIGLTNTKGHSEADFIDSEGKKIASQTFEMAPDETYTSGAFAIGTLKVCKDLDHEEADYSKEIMRLPKGLSFTDVGSIDDKDSKWWLLTVALREPASLKPGQKCVTVKAHVIGSEIPPALPNMKGLTRFKLSDKRRFEIGGMENAEAPMPDLPPWTNKNEPPLVAFAETDFR